MHSWKDIAQIFSALGNERRLRILESIEKGISNPGEMARKMSLPRSTVEKHIRVLHSAGLVEKVPSLSPEGHLRLYYNITDVTKNVLKTVKKNIKNTNGDKSKKNF